MWGLFSADVFAARVSGSVSFGSTRIVVNPRPCPPPQRFAPRPMPPRPSHIVPPRPTPPPPCPPRHRPVPLPMPIVITQPRVVVVEAAPTVVVESAEIVSTDPARDFRDALEAKIAELLHEKKPTQTYEISAVVESYSVANSVIKTSVTVQIKRSSDGATQRLNVNSTGYSTKSLAELTAKKIAEAATL